jgi:hypothetical protein
MGMAMSCWFVVDPVQSDLFLGSLLKMMMVPRCFYALSLLASVCYSFTVPSTLQRKTPVRVSAATLDLDVVALVAGQENYGLAVVCLGEAIYSFVQAPSLSHAKILIPAGLAAIILGVVSGPAITSGDESQVQFGLWIAMATSIALGASYVARLAAPFSPSPKEAAGLGLLIAFAGFWSFSQNLIVDGFVELPSLPTVPSLPNVF